MKRFGKKLVSAVLVLALMLTAVLPVMAAEGIPAEGKEKTVFYVAVDGSDENSGTIESPFATVEKARDTIRELKANGSLAEGGAVVYFRGGSYKIDKTVAFNKEDGGTKEAPVIYRNYPGEDVEFVGGIKIDFNQFSKVTDEKVLGRIVDEAAREKVVSVNLFDLGITEIPENVMPGSYTYWADVREVVPGLKEPSAMGIELVVNGKGQTIARYPNNEAFEIGEVIKQRSFETVTPFTITIDDDRVKNWEKAEDAVLTGTFQFSWGSESVPIASVNGDKNTITASWPTTHEATMGQHVWVYNLIEEIDVPGEYYIDRNTGELYYYPAEEEINEICLTTLGELMVNFNGCEYVTLKGIDLKYMRAGAVQFTSANNCSLIDSEVTFTGKTACGVYGYNNQILDCWFHDVAAGVSLNSSDSKYTVGNLIENGNIIENTKLERCDRITKTYSDCIVLGACGNYARYNEMSDSTHLLARMSGNKNVFEYNEFHDACTDTDDMGALYTGRNLTHRGNIIRYNYFHDIGGKDRGTNGTHGIFLDDWWSAADVTGNVFADITGYGVMAAGSHNVFDNNIFANCGKGSLNLKRSYDYGNPGTNEVYINGVNALKEYWNEEVWLETYPTMANVIDENGEPDMNNYIVATDNVMFKTELPAVSEQVAKTITNENNFQYDKDPGFYNVRKQNYTLEEDSVVFTDNPDFEPIPFDRMGRYSEKALERVRKAYVYCIDSAWAVRKGKVEKTERAGAIVVGGKVYLPIRDIVEAAKGSITYNEETEVIEISAGGKTVSFTDGDTETVTVDAVNTVLNAPIVNIGNVNFVSAEEFAKMFGSFCTISNGVIVISEKDNLFDVEADKEMLRYLEEIITVY